MWEEQNDRAAAYRVRNAAAPWGLVKPASGPTRPAFPRACSFEQDVCAESTVCKRTFIVQGVSAVLLPRDFLPNAEIPVLLYFDIRTTVALAKASAGNKKPGLVRTGFVAMVMVHIIDRNTGSCWYQSVAAWAWHSLSARSPCDTALLYVVSFRSFFFRAMKSPGCWPGRSKGSLVFSYASRSPGIHFGSLIRYRSVCVQLPHLDT